VNTLKNPADLLSKNVTQKIHDSHAIKYSMGQWIAGMRRVTKI
jgi:hypothetical protein